MKRAVFDVLVLFALGAAPPASAQAPARVSPPRATSSVDRTAMWIGDRIAFTIEVV